MGDLGQRVGLVHELRQRVCAEECVDNRRDGLCVDEVDGGEYLRVTYVHAFADGARHAGEAHAELVVELLADGAHATVRKVVDVVDVSLRVDELDEVLDDVDDVLAGQDLHVHRGVQVEFLVDAVAAYFAEVVALVAEEKVLDNLAGRRIIRRLRVAELSVDELHGLLLRVGGVLLEGIEDDGIVRGVDILLVEQDVCNARFENFVDVFFLEHSLAVDNHIVTFNRNNFAGILVDEVLDPGLEHTRGELAADGFLEVGLVDLYLFGKTENFNDVLIAFEADGTQESGHGEFLLAVDIGVHDIVDVSGKFDPRAAERYDTGRIKLGAVGVGGLAEEHARRTVELRHYNALGTVDYESSLLGHVGDGAEIHVLNFSSEVFVVGVSAIELQFCL